MRGPWGGRGSDSINRIIYEATGPNIGVRAAPFAAFLDALNIHPLPHHDVIVTARGYLHDVEHTLHRLVSMPESAGIRKQTPPAPPAPSGLTESSPESKGMTWQEAAERMDRLRNQGEAYTSTRDLAERLGCRSTSTIKKAIDNTPELHGWAKRPTAVPRAQSVNGVVLDSASQSRELDPADDAALREYIERADPKPRLGSCPCPSPNSSR